MTGAVDLAAIKARSEAAARAAQAPAPTATDSIIDVTEAGFQAAVLDRSHQVPVLIALWSARSPTSVQLTADLEKLAREGAGAYILAKIDVDANMRIVQALQAQGVPAVFAVLAGQLIPGFEGALPEAQLREFITAVLQAAGEAGLAGAATAPDLGSDSAPPEPPEDPRFDAAEEALAAGDFALAEQRFQAILDVEPANADALRAIGQVRLLARVSAASPTAVEDATANPTDVSMQLMAADIDFVGENIDGALKRLLDLLAITGGEERDTVRHRLLEYFELLGPEDERVPGARRTMARTLF